MAYKYLNDDGLKAYTKKVKGALKDLHTPIAISIENTTESKAQNVRNIADFIAKAKAAGIADVNGMVVTCFINDACSGVGYLSGDTSICGIETDTGLEAPYYFVIDPDGTYTENIVLVNGSSDQITSLMLTQGARKPIILTPETTEVDEETYQKLLSDDVDVVFKTENNDLCSLTYRYTSSNILELRFTCINSEAPDLPDSYIYTYGVAIEKAPTHKVDVYPYLANDIHATFMNNGFINKSILKPVLQEIDLTGTDTERKAKLDQFEVDWKTLTGASDLTGARFVGYVDAEAALEKSVIFSYNAVNDYWSGVNSSSDGITSVTINPYDGSLIITPLFSHLEPVEILFDNTAEKKKKNLDNLNAYKSNLEQLGVDTSNGYSVPVRITGNAQEYHGMLNIGTGALLSGIVTNANGNHHYPFNVSTADGAITFDTNNYFLEKTSNEVTDMLDAIKYSYTPVPLTATASTNKTQLDLFLSTVPNAQVMHVTYKDAYAGTLHKINGSWYGVLVGESNTLAGQLSIKLQADGTIVEGTA